MDIIYEVLWEQHSLADFYGIVYQLAFKHAHIKKIPSFDTKFLLLSVLIFIS